MGSSRPTDRSLGETTFLPQWMKGKLDTRFDYTDSTFSPPADDDFFFIRYPKNDGHSNVKKDGFRPINEVFGNENKALSKATTSTDKYGNRDAKKVDFSKHTIPCQQYIPFPTTAEKVNEPKIIIANKPKIKQTTDDELRNPEASECGRSIVSVANQIMSSKFGKSNSSENHPGQHDESSSIAQRTVSKSLPATPIASPSGTPDSSPRSRRRMYGNRFFSGAFVSAESSERKNGWLLSSILGQSREMVTSKIDEEDEQQIEQPVIPARAMNRKKSISSQNLTYLGKEESAGVKVHSLLQPKASELREMNFWSPTSM